MAGKSGFGAKFQLSATAITGTTGELAELTAVGMPSSEVELIETTNHGSVGAQREFIAGLIDGAELSMGMNLVPGSTTDTACETALASRAEQFFKITVPAATGTWTYSGKCIVLSYEKDDATIDEKMGATLNIKPTGVVTRAAGV